MESSTRSEIALANLNWRDIYSQLFLGQTPQHILGVHRRGNFSKIEVRRLDDPELRGLNAVSQHVFRQLRVVLGSIQEIMVEHSRRGTLSLVYQGRELKVYERMGGGDCVPSDVLRRFDSKDSEL